MIDLLDRKSKIPPESEIGGKAAMLMRLWRTGFRLSGGYVLPAAFAARFMLRSRIDTAGENAAEEILNTAFDKTEIEILNTVFQRTGGGGKVIVRSSVPGEDGTDRSYAGVYESVSEVSTPLQLADAVKHVWSSYLAPRACSYRGGSADAPPMPVLIQKMLSCECAGVLFTRHPVTGENSFVAEVCRGGCRPVVDGAGQACRYIWKRGGTIDTAASGGPLTPDSAKLLQNMAENVTARLGDGWDIEWGISSGKLYVFQARPITSAGDGLYHDISGGSLDCVLLDRFASPASVCYLSLLDAWQDRMFFSFYSSARGGAPEDRPLCFIRNRVYWNLKFQKKFFEDTGEVDTEKRRRLLRKMERGWRSWYRRLGRYRRQVRVLSRKVREAADTETLLALLGRVTDNFCDYLGADHFRFLGFAQISYKWARTAYAEAGLEESAADAAIARRGMKSSTVKANRELMQIAEKIRRSRAAYRLFSEREPAEIRSMLRCGVCPEIYKNLRVYLKKHGHRGMHCDDILYPHLREKPEYLISVLKQYLRRLSSHDEKNRTDSEQQTQGTEASSDIPATLRRRVKKTARLAGIYMCLREDQRYEFDRSWLLIRRILLRLGEALVSEGTLKAREDIFHLTAGEIRQCAGAGMQNAAAVASRRRRLFLQEKGRTPPYLFKESEEVEIQRRQEGKRYKTTGISGGEARGRIRLLRGTEDFSRLCAGDIGVVHTFHPSWTPMLKLVAGLIMSYGNMLSHGAVVAREYRIPVVVFNGDAMQHFNEGELVELNGTTGRVRRLRAENEAANARTG